MLWFYLDRSDMLKRITLLVITIGLILNGLQALLFYQFGVFTHIIHELHDHHEHTEAANFNLRLNEFGHIVVTHSHSKTNHSSNNQNQSGSHDHVFVSTIPFTATFQSPAFFDFVQICLKKIDISFPYKQLKLPLTFIAEILRPPIP
jgi:hypothetical protein